MNNLTIIAFELLLYEYLICLVIYIFTNNPRIFFYFYNSLIGLWWTMLIYCTNQQIKYFYILLVNSPPGYLNLFVCVSGVIVHVAFIALMYMYRQSIRILIQINWLVMIWIKIIIVISWCITFQVLADLWLWASE